MEIKYTLEILTKDIQDIGKLVENLQNSPEGSTLELDLALSKLRNVYDILSVIRTDTTIPGQLYRKTAETVAPPTPEPQEPEEAPQIEPRPQTVAEVVAEAPPVKPEPEAVAEAVTEVVAEAPPVKPEPEAVAETPPPQQKTQQAHNDSGILADKFLAQSSVNENLAGKREGFVESKMTPIDNIGRNIGINDRFLIIRELFDGDSDGFGNLIKDLDNAENIKVANERLSIQFEKTPDHEGVAILSRLVKRKYSLS